MKIKRFKWLTPSVARVLGVTAFLMLTANVALFSRLLQVYPAQPGNIGFLLSVTTLLSAATAFFLLLVLNGRRTASVLTGWVLVSSAVCAYFMDRYATVIDIDMLDNTFQTNVAEASDLLDWTFFVRVLLLGLLPAILLHQRPPVYRPWLTELKSRLIVGLMLVVVMLACVAPYTARYASFIREHKSVRYYANPTFPTWSLARWLGKQFKDPAASTLQTVAADAHLQDPRHQVDYKELIILVVGETARADRFSLNGYGRQTNPVLEREAVVSFRQVSACGTSTAVSVPCMFSGIDPDQFSVERAGAQQNVLDVLARNGVEILWRDNNSDSKGVATRLAYEDFKSPTTNPVCDTECRDVGMLAGLEKWVAAHPDKDLLIVLHQMGNHGPAYYKRYPAAFEYFKPVCKSSELSSCTAAELNNAYDNAIRYTDHFLGQVIAFLKRHDQSHATAMLYVSDHGESLGEGGLYLHGAPKLIAPTEQTHVATIAWVGRHFDWTLDQLRAFRDKPLSHGDLFCALLMGFEVQTQGCLSRRVGAS